MLSFLSFLSHTACTEAVLRSQQVYGAAELHSSIALSCALQIRMITIRRQDQALDSFEASACSSLHTLNDASWIVLSYTRFRQKRGSCAPRASCIWAWLDGIARVSARARRQLGSDPQTSTQEAPATAELRPLALAAAGSGRGGPMRAWGGAGRGAPGIWIPGTRPFLGTLLGVPMPSC